MEASARERGHRSGARVDIGLDQRACVTAADRAGRAPPGQAPKRWGRKLMERDPGVREALERLVEPVSRGDPQSALCWTCKSLMQLARALSEQGHAISHVSVGVLLKDMGYSLQGNRKTLEGPAIPTAMPSSNTSTRRRKRPCVRGSR